VEDGQIGEFAKDCDVTTYQKLGWINKATGACSKAIITNYEVALNWFWANTSLASTSSARTHLRCTIIDRTLSQNPIRTRLLVLFSLIMVLDKHRLYIITTWHS
jgi:hypothetical protein